MEPNHLATRFLMVLWLIGNAMGAVLRGSQNTCRCGILRQGSNPTCPEYELMRSMSDEERIINGGEVCPAGKYSFVARIFDEAAHMICTGTLINSEWVLTAGHCIDPRSFAGSYKIVIGNHHSEMPDANLDTHESYGSATWRHPQYEDRPALNDVGLIRLKTPVSFNTTSIRPVCLPTSTEDGYAGINVGDTATFIGWGSTAPGYMPRLPETLMEGSAKVISNSECKTYDELHNELVEDTMICLQDDEQEQRTCNGDSGGPMLSGTGTATDPFTIQGVVSWGVKFCPNTPSVFTRVTSYIHDILQQASSGDYCSAT